MKVLILIGKCLLGVLALGGLIIGGIIAAFIGLVIHLALFALPFIIIAVVALRDWWIIRQLKKHKPK